MRCYAQIFWRVLGGSVDNEDDKLENNKKIKISEQKISFGNSPEISLSPPVCKTINTKGHMLSLQLRKIHFFIIDSFCLYYVIHPFYTDTKVPYIFMLRPSESLLVIKQQTVSIEW